MSDFLSGQIDCKNGIEHKAGNGEQYDAGYAYQYEIEAREGADQ